MTVYIMFVLLTFFVKPVKAVNLAVLSGQYAIPRGNAGLTV